VLHPMLPVEPSTATFEARSVINPPSAASSSESRSGSRQDFRTVAWPPGPCGQARHARARGPCYSASASGASLRSGWETRPTRRMGFPTRPNAVATATVIRLPAIYLAVRYATIGRMSRSDCAVSDDRFLRCHSWTGNPLRSRANARRRMDFRTARHSRSALPAGQDESNLARRRFTHSRYNEGLAGSKIAPSDTNHVIARFTPRRRFAGSARPGITGVL
jgi:hypothetical protein